MSWNLSLHIHNLNHVYCSTYYIVFSHCSKNLQLYELYWRLFDTLLKPKIDIPYKTDDVTLQLRYKHHIDTFACSEHTENACWVIVITIVVILQPSFYFLPTDTSRKMRSQNQLTFIHSIKRKLNVRNSVRALIIRKHFLSVPILLLLLRWPMRNVNVQIYVYNKMHGTRMKRAKQQP